MDNLYYMRHGETEYNASNLWCGAGSDVPLNTTGELQVQLAGEAIAASGAIFDVIISTPLLRGQQTARHIARSIGYPIERIIVSDLFKERHFGELEGHLNMPEVMAAYALSETAVDGYGGENFYELQARADSALEYLRRLDYHTGLVVGHGTFGRALYRSIYGLPIDTPWPAPLGNAEVAEYGLALSPISVEDKSSVNFDSVVSSAIYTFHLSIRQWQIDNTNHLFTNFFESSEDLPNIHEYYIESGGNFFLATDNKTQKAVGIVGLRNDGNGLGTLKRMGVSPDLHRQKIGTKLVGELLRWARENGFTRIQLATGKNENAKPLYEKYGFRVVGRTKRNGDYEMELSLID